MAGDYPFHAGIAHFSTKTSVAEPGQPECVEEAHMQWRTCVTGPLRTSWPGGESLAMRIVVVASVVVLFVGCGRETPTAPTPTVVATPAVTPAPTVLRSYEVVFVADAVCTELPPVARTRTYTGAYDGFLLHLSGSDFSIPAPIGYFAWDVIHLEVSQDSATAYFSDPPIWEHPTPDTDLMIEGNAKGGAVNGDGQISFSFRGSFVFCRGECAVAPIACSAQNHRLTLTPK